MAQADGPYKCGFPNCYNIFGTLDEAKKCEVRGIIDPKIELGLVLECLRQPFTFAIVTNELFPTHHRRWYELAVVQFPLGGEEHCVTLRSNNTTGGDIEMKLKAGVLRLADYDQVQILQESPIVRGVFDKLGRSVPVFHSRLPLEYVQT